MNSKSVKPFLKWAGGKRWLASSGVLPDLTNHRKYIEPFLGSAAVFFHTRPRAALLSDVNAELIHLFKVIRDAPREFAAAMVYHNDHHSREYYYYVRSETFSDSIRRAARFLYLNRTCWNGLYRVNLKGTFNVPIGTKSSVLFPDDDFEEVAKALAAAELLCSDFEPIIAQAEEGDLLFVDPPYTVRHNFNGFLKYNEKIFSWADQVRLSECVKSAADRGVAVVVTNANHESVRELYANRFSYRELTRVSVLAASAEKRGITTEAIFQANVRRPS